VLLLLLLHFAALTGAYWDGLPGGLTVEFRFGGVPRLVAAAIASNTVPAVCFLLARRFRCASFATAFVMISVAGMLLTLVPREQPGSYFLSGYKEAHGVDFQPYWSGAARESKLAEATSVVAADDESELELSRGTGVLERITRLWRGFSTGVVYTVVRQIAGTGRCLEEMSLPPGNRLRTWAESYILERPYLVPQ